MAMSCNLLIISFLGDQWTDQQKIMIIGNIYTQLKGKKHHDNTWQTWQDSSSEPGCEILWDLRRYYTARGPRALINVDWWVGDGVIIQIIQFEALDYSN